MNKLSRTRAVRDAISNAADGTTAHALAATPDFSGLRQTLAARACENEWASLLLDLLEQYETNRAQPLPVTLPKPLPVPFDGRFEDCFEQMLSLLHRQNVQIAELWQIVTDLL